MGAGRTNADAAGRLVVSPHLLGDAERGERDLKQAGEDRGGEEVLHPVIANQAHDDQCLVADLEVRGG